MVWDCAIIFIAITFSIGGWNTGLVNSWRVPIAILVATFVTQLIYVDFCAWLVDHTKLGTIAGFLCGYAFLWIALEVGSEKLLRILLPWMRRATLRRLDHVGGTLVGAVTAMILVIFASMACTSAPELPEAPSRPSIVAFFSESVDDSRVLDMCQNVSAKMPEKLAQVIVSSRQPAYVPTYADTPIVKTDQYNTDRFRNVFKVIRDAREQL